MRICSATLFHLSIEFRQRMFYDRNNECIIFVFCSSTSSGSNRRDNVIVLLINSFFFFLLGFLWYISWLMFEHISGSLRSFRELVGSDYSILRDYCSVFHGKGFLWKTYFIKVQVKLKLLFLSRLNLFVRL